jgi:hypothetical protein
MIHFRCVGYADTVVEAINAQPSSAMLFEWLDEAVTAPTLSDFIAVLRR